MRNLRALLPENLTNNNKSILDQCYEFATFFLNTEGSRFPSIPTLPWCLVTQCDLHADSGISSAKISNGRNRLLQGWKEKDHTKRPNYLLSVFAFFVRLFQHELVESLQSHIITIEVIGLLSKNRTHLVQVRRGKVCFVQTRFQTLPWTCTRN